MTNRRDYNGVSNKELLFRVLDELDAVRTTLDTKADRADLIAIRATIQTEAQDARERADVALANSNLALKAKVGRLELFGWLAFASGLVGMVVGIL